MQAAQMGAPRAVTARKVPQRSIASKIVRTGFVAILIAGVGAGARFGYDYYEHGRSGETAATQAVETQTGFLPPIGTGLPTVEAAPVAGRYVDVSLKVDGVEIDGETETATTRWQYNVVSFDLTLSYDGTSGTFELQVRDDQLLLSPAGDQRWYDVSDDPTVAAIPIGLAELRGTVPMFHDLVPVAAIPYVSVTAEADEQLTLVALDPPFETVDTETVATGNVDPLFQQEVEVLDAPGSDVLAFETAVPRPTSSVPVRHYTLSFDQVAFAAEAPFAHAEWSASDWWVGETLDLWVDEFGVVRKHTRADGTGTSTITIHDVADEFPDFQSVLPLVTVIPDFGD